MFDTLEKPQTARPSDAPELGESSYRGPERRAGNGLRNEPWLTLMLDEIDYGMLVLSPDGHLLHANHTARAEMDAHHPLQLLGTELRARHSADVAPLREAMQGAAERKLRRLLTLGPASQALSVAVVPLAARGDEAVTILMVFGKQRVCQELSTHWFARQHGLTPTETQVLQGLCRGRLPGEVAQEHSVALSTVRSQISSIRAKTGALNIRDLVQKVASLPPLVSALRVGMH
ncbi:MAG: helix-turn-helix transcriptional regulator [Burkholderiaceae bacterium]|nr:helix-turn-helix transcriptional regulator [Burkholderiaceae bacterium]MBT9499699.1 helix-turn-helix transcriptional regulator [Burkholderiaceae bacterium]